MSDLLKHPYEPYWDEKGQITRRELQKAINKLASNDAELMGMADTAALVLNFILEVKFGVKDKEELEIYVAAKKLQLDEARAKMKAAATEAAPSVLAEG